MRVRSPGKCLLALAFALLDVSEGESIQLELGEARSCPQLGVQLEGRRLGLGEVLGPLPAG